MAVACYAHLGGVTHHFFPHWKWQAANKITNLEGLDGLPELQRLHLRKNPVCGRGCPETAGGVFA